MDSWLGGLSHLKGQLTNLITESTEEITDVVDEVQIARGRVQELEARLEFTERELRTVKERSGELEVRLRSEELRVENHKERLREKEEVIEVLTRSRGEPEGEVNRSATVRGTTSDEDDEKEIQIGGEQRGVEWWRRRVAELEEQAVQLQGGHEVSRLLEEQQRRLEMQHSDYVLQLQDEFQRQLVAAVAAARTDNARHTSDSDDLMQYDDMRNTWTDYASEWVQTDETTVRHLSTVDFQNQILLPREEAILALEAISEAMKTDTLANVLDRIRSPLQNSCPQSPRQSGTNSNYKRWSGGAVDTQSQLSDVSEVSVRSRQLEERVRELARQLAELELLRPAPQLDGEKQQKVDLVGRVQALQVRVCQRKNAALVEDEELQQEEDDAEGSGAETSTATESPEFAELTEAVARLYELVIGADSTPAGASEVGAGEMLAEMEARLRCLDSRTSLLQHVANFNEDKDEEITRLGQETLQLQSLLEERDDESAELRASLAVLSDELDSVQADLERARTEKQLTRSEASSVAAAVAIQADAAERGSRNQDEMDEDEMLRDKVDMVEAELEGARIKERELQTAMILSKERESQLTAEMSQGVEERRRLEERNKAELDWNRAELVRMADEIEMLSVENEKMEDELQHLRKGEEEDEAVTGKQQMQVNQLERLVESAVQEREWELEAERQRGASLAAMLQQQQDGSEATQKELDWYRHNREELVAALSQKHEESVSYHAEIQRLAGLVSCEQQQDEHDEPKAAVEVVLNGSDDTVCGPDEEDKLLHQVAQLHERLEKIAREKTVFQEHLVRVEEQYTAEAALAEDRELGLRRQLRDMERSQEEWSEHRQTEMALQQERDLAREDAKKLSKELHEARAGLGNLQAAVDGFQKDQTSELRFQREETARARAEIESFKTIVADLRVQLQEQLEAVAAAERLSEKIEQKEDQLIRFQTELSRRDEIVDSLRMEVRQVNTVTESKVDKILMRNLVVGYFHTPTNKRTEALRVIGSLLHFTDHDYEQIGVDTANRARWFNWLRGNGDRNDNSDAAAVQKSFSELFVSFLERESNPLPQVRLPLYEPSSAQPRSPPSDQLGELSFTASPVMDPHKFFTSSPLVSRRLEPPLPTAAASNQIVTGSQTAPGNNAGHQRTDSGRNALLSLLNNIQ